jgi:hypothetical protein
LVIMLIKRAVMKGNIIISSTDISTWVDCLMTKASSFFSYIRNFYKHSSHICPLFSYSVLYIFSQLVSPPSYWPPQGLFHQLFL